MDQNKIFFTFYSPRKFWNTYIAVSTKILSNIIVFNILEHQINIWFHSNVSSQE